MDKKFKIIFFLSYLVFGAYFINSSLNFITLPEFISKIDNWILFIGGILIIVGGINSLRAGKKLSY
ncbi:hypothetical protein KAJ87_01825 [Candidatus Pacearchaeota archaeon]|nr:hypothetical protein [Candidatus Pacearchaeota archaeon]